MAPLQSPNSDIYLPVGAVVRVVSVGVHGGDDEQADRLKQSRDLGVETGGMRLAKVVCQREQQLSAAGLQTGVHRVQGDGAWCVSGARQLDISIHNTAAE